MAREERPFLLTCSCRDPHQPFVSPRLFDSTYEAVRDRLVSHVDLVPTILGWCGDELPAAMLGVDIRGLVEGGDTPVHDGIALEYHSAAWGSSLVPQRGWRTEDWKYVATLDGTDELYDLRRDPLERHNLIGDPTAAGALDVMRRELHAWLEQTGDRWPDVPVTR